MPALDKNYKPADHEPRIWKRWEDSRAFHADPAKVVSGKAKPYSIIIPPPNVTGRLHLGHALNNTLQDILIRAHRMMGFEAMWMPGTDHAGIATQSVVEKRLLQEENLKRSAMGREAFVARVQAWKDEYEETITGQLKAMGCSCDFDRQRFTMDDICAKAVREAFFRLFRDGLIYRGKRLVNWDPITQTALADDEVVNEEIEGSFYYLRYPLVRHQASGTGHQANAVPITWSELARLGYPGASSQPADQAAWVTVATTRPETYLGDTAVAINPKDPRANALRGLHVQLPLVGRIIPIVEDDYVVMPAKDPDAEGVDAKAKFATGFLKVTPAHDPNDYDIGNRHKLAVINVMAPDASISDKHGWTDIGDAHLFVGLSREDARKKVVAEFKARGLLENIRPYTHSVGHSDRSGAAIEPYLSDQWYVKVTDDKLRAAALRAMTPEQRNTPTARAARSTPQGDGSMTFYPERYARTFETWHENLRDWCISRQLWWGHRIPVWTYIQWGGGHTNSAPTELTQAIEKYLRINGANDPRVTVVIKSPKEVFICAASSEADSLLGIFDDYVDKMHSQRSDWPAGSAAPEPTEMPNEVSRFHNADIASFNTLASYRRVEQDPDVLDTWFSSALWPISTMGWPDTKGNGGDFEALLKAYNSSNVLCTAREIITLWVSRMTMFNRYFMGEGAGHGPVPFHDVFIHAMIQDGEGQKMSKSLGNGVDPLDIISSHGADAMRFTLCDMTTQTQDVRMPVDIFCPHCAKSFEPRKITNQSGYVVAAPTQTCPHCSKSSVSSYGLASGSAKPDAKTPSAKNTSSKFDKGRNYCTKLWNAAKFTMMILEESGGAGSADGPSVHLSDLSQVDRWMIARIVAATQRIEDSLKNYEFNNYAQAVYELLWWDFCDWYLEAIKPTVRTSPAQQAVLRAALDTILRLLHPVAPYVTETIQEAFGGYLRAPVQGLALPPSQTGLLCSAPWPHLSLDLASSPALKAVDAEFSRVKGLVDAIRQARSGQAVEPRRKVTLHSPPELADLIRGAQGVVETLAGLEKVVAEAPAGNTQGAVVVFEGRELLLSNLKDAVDPAVERTALTEGAAKLEKEIAVLEARLANPGYADKAPAKMVQETRDTLARKQAEVGAMRRRLEELS